LDRIDITLQSRPVEVNTMTELKARRKPSSEYRSRVEAARERQAHRYADTPGILTNAQMTPQQLGRFCSLNARGQKLLTNAVDTFGLSARAHDRILKLARTRADLEGRADIAEFDLMFAINCRVTDRRSWLGAVERKFEEPADGPASPDPPAHGEVPWACVDAVGQK
jgi:magnesium chelatase family protein